MIGEFMLDVVFGIVMGILDFFASLGIFTITWAVGEEEMSVFLQIVRSILYFFPVNTVVQIVGLIFLFGCFRAVSRLIATIWDWLPIV